MAALGVSVVRLPSTSPANASWSFARKDMEVYGATGYAITVGADKLRVRHEHDSDEQLTTAASLSGPQSNSLSYLAAVLREHGPALCQRTRAEHQTARGSATTDRVAGRDAAAPARRPGADR